MATEEVGTVESFLQQPVPDQSHELRQSLVFAKNMIESLKQDNEELHNRLQLVDEMDEMSGGPLQGASMAVSFGGKIMPNPSNQNPSSKQDISMGMVRGGGIGGGGGGGIKDELFGDLTDSDHPSNRLKVADPEAQRILSKKKSKHDRFFSTYNLLSREVNNSDQMIQQLGTFESIVRYHKSAQTYNSIIDNLSMQFKQNKDSLSDAHEQLKQYKIDISEELDSTNIEHYQKMIETTIDIVLSEGSKWLDSIDAIKDEFSGARALVHPDHQKVANYEIKLRELQAALPVEATAKLAALGVLPEFVKKALDDEDIEEEEKKKKSKQKKKRGKSSKRKNAHHEQKRTLLINDDFDARDWENDDLDDGDDPDDDMADDDDGYSDGMGDDGGYEADYQDEYEDPTIAAYNDLLRTANIIKNTILQKIDTAKTFIETDTIRAIEDISSSIKSSNNNNNNSSSNNNNDISAISPNNMRIPNADGDEDDYEYDKTPDVYDPMSKFDDIDNININGGVASSNIDGAGGTSSGYTKLVDSIEEELKQFADVLVRAGEYVHPSQRALIFACKEIVKQRTENNRLKKRIDQLEGELAEARNTLNAKQNELNNIHTEARANGGVLKVYSVASDAIVNGLSEELIKEIEISWLPEMADSMRTINRQCNDLDNLLVVSEDYEDNDEYVMKTVRKNIDNEKVLETIQNMKTSVREFCRTIMKTYHLVPPHVNYVRQLEDEFQFSKGYCRKVYKEVDDTKDAIYHRDNVIREKDIMIEQLEDRLARIMTSASASAETRMEALMGMNKKIQSYNKIMDVVSDEISKRNDELNNLEDKCRNKLDSSSFRKVRKFVKEMITKNAKSADIMRTEMENARLYVHSDRVMVDKLQDQVLKLKNELAEIQEKIETGRIYDETDEDNNNNNNNSNNNNVNNTYRNGTNNSNDINNNNYQNGIDNDHNHIDDDADDDPDDEDEEERSESRRRRRKNKNKKDRDRKGIQFGPNVKDEDEDDENISNSRKKNTRHSKGKSVHDIAFRQHMIQIDEEIEAIKKTSEMGEDVARLNKEINELKDKNGKLSSEIGHLRRTLEAYQNRNDNIYTNQMDSDGERVPNSNQSEMQEEIYTLRKKNRELSDMIQAQRIANNDNQTPGGPDGNNNNNNNNENITTSNNNNNNSNSLLFDSNEAVSMGNEFDTPGGGIDGMHDDDDIIGGTEITTGGGGIYDTPMGPSAGGNYEEDALIELTKQVEQQRQYIMELSVKIKRLETDFVKDKLKLLESTNAEMEHLRSIIKQFRKQQKR